MSETLEQPDFEDQYIAVLLEFYAVKVDLDRRSPLERAQLTYWQKMLHAYERSLPIEVRNRIRYRARKAESRDLGPIQTALIRFAWNSYLTGTDDEAGVVKRWESYYLGGLSSQGNMVEFQMFQRKRQFQEIIREIRSEGLWPWGN